MEAMFVSSASERDTPPEALPDSADPIKGWPQVGVRNRVIKLSRLSFGTGKNEQKNSDGVETRPGGYGYRVGGDGTSWGTFGRPLSRVFEEDLMKTSYQVGFGANKPPNISKFSLASQNQAAVSKPISPLPSSFLDLVMTHKHRNNVSSGNEHPSFTIAVPPDNSASHMVDHESGSHLPLPFALHVVPFDPGLHVACGLKIAQRVRKRVVDEVGKLLAPIHDRRHNGIAISDFMQYFPPIFPLSEVTITVSSSFLSEGLLTGLFYWPPLPPPPPPPPPVTFPDTPPNY